MSDQVKRVRSPNYPAHGLPIAVQQLRALHDRIQKHAAPKEAVIKGLGYSGLNGASGAALSASLKFGLIERRDDDTYKITECGMRILFPHPKEDGARALTEAARAPSLYVDLIGEFGLSVPHENILEPWLVRRGFARSAVSAVIQGYRDTMELVANLAGGYKDGEDEGRATPSQEEAVSTLTPRAQPQTMLPPPPQGAREERIVDDEGNNIVIRFPVEPTTETYEFLRDYLDFRAGRVRKLVEQKVKQGS